eukprot:2807494-Amphidinium_carterae.3
MAVSGKRQTIEADLWPMVKGLLKEGKGVLIALPLLNFKGQMTEVSKDTPWALHRKVGGQLVACDDKCDACAALHQTAFSLLTWSEFCDASDESHQQAKLEAKQLLSDPSGKRPFNLAVDGNLRCSFDITKDFYVASEADLRWWTKMSRLSKKALAGVPKVTVGSEDLYVFADNQQQLRRGTLKASTETVLTEHSLKQQDILWSGQAAAHYEQKQQTSSYLELLSPTTQLMTPSEFLSKRIGVAASTPEVIRGGPAGSTFGGKDLSDAFAAAAAKKKMMRMRLH